MRPATETPLAQTSSVDTSAPVNGDMSAMASLVLVSKREKNKGTTATKASLNVSWKSA